MFSTEFVKWFVSGSQSIEIETLFTFLLDSNDFTTSLD